MVEKIISFSNLLISDKRFLNIFKNYALQSIFTKAWSFSRIKLDLFILKQYTSYGLIKSLLFISFLVLIMLYWLNISDNVLRNNFLDVSGKKPLIFATTFLKSSPLHMKIHPDQTYLYWQNELSLFYLAKIFHTRSDFLIISVNQVS